jgi:hypothetical protein
VGGAAAEAACNCAAVALNGAAGNAFTGSTEVWARPIDATPTNTITKENNLEKLWKEAIDFSQNWDFQRR